MEPNPALSILQIAGGYCLSRCLHIVADLGVADALDGSSRTAADLAAAVGANPDALGRAMRLLAAHGVFESDGRAFRHSAASRLLRTDHPHSLRTFARMFGLPVFWQATGALEHTIGSGQPSAHKGYPGGFWAYLADNPEAGRIFNAAMQGKAHGQVAAVVAAYDFSRFRRIGDIGGGHGHLIRAILDGVPDATGVLFDLPHVVADVASAAPQRLTVQGGDFFKDPLPNCDAYLIMEVIHDWGDEESVAILRAIRRAAPPTARLLLMEQLVPEQPGPDWTKTLDIHMLALFGGRQRTREEYGALLVRAGFSLERVIETAGGVSILEATVGAPSA